VNQRFVSLMDTSKVSAKPSMRLSWNLSIAIVKCTFIPTQGFCSSHCPIVSLWQNCSEGVMLVDLSDGLSLGMTGKATGTHGCRDSGTRLRSGLNPPDERAG
jgi:hypothetical protein